MTSTTRIPVDEASFQRTVEDLLEVLGYRYLHVHPSLNTRGQWSTSTSTVGWPDLFCWKAGRVLAIECKSDKGRVTPDQQAVLASLEDAGVPTQVARPRDFDELVEWLR